MSRKYKHGDSVPADVVVKRLHELSRAVTTGKEAVAREFTMRIPAEMDRDADLILGYAGDIIKQLTKERDALREALKFLIEVKCHKDIYGKDEWYEDAQPMAWEQAAKALAP